LPQITTGSGKILDTVVFIINCVYQAVPDYVAVDAERAIESPGAGPERPPLPLIYELAESRSQKYNAGGRAY